MQDYEKLGSFYLGKIYNSKDKKVEDSLVMYDSKDLTTHAMCVGMTGSGKTGLCITLLEEAAIDNIPVIIIDPKGDMTNLLLTFPEFKTENYLPWINKNDASAKGVTPEQFAASQGELWKNGLEKWGQSGERIKKFKESAEFSVYTPGSSYGIPISILKSFDAPPKELLEDNDLFSEKISSTATSILGLVGINADPLKSREHILISNILKYYWEQGTNLELVKLIQAIQNPPIKQIGAFDVESFYPSKDRFDLAISLNGLLSAPSFKSWLEGEPLDIDNTLHNAQGKPKVSVFYIAHLNDNERMFFVTMLFNQVTSWMRKQTGTGSLRAILYFDEIFGYMPPVANPPSKQPLMLLLKQARAFGLGIVLATQNPVDLDYKALSNIGTWFIGRLQTDRDKQRVLDGLEGATNEGGSSFNRNEFEKIITSLDKRVFLLHNVHEDRPEIFQTRWALSYLAGPLSSMQVKGLMSSKNIAEAPLSSNQNIQNAAVSQNVSSQPIISAGITQYFIPVRGPLQNNAELIYKPYLLCNADTNYINAKLKVDQKESSVMIFPISDGPVPIDWQNGKSIDVAMDDLLNSSEKNSSFFTLPSEASNDKNYSKWGNDFEDYIYRNNSVDLLTSPSLKTTSLPNETERDFRVRLNQTAREERDEWIEKLREKYAKKSAAIESKIRTAEVAVEREKAQSSQQNLTAAINLGATLLGAFLGRKTFSSTTVSKAGTTLKSAGKILKEKQDVQRASENIAILKQQLQDLENELQQEINEYTEKNDITNEQFETTKIRPKKMDIKVNLCSLSWVPFWQLQDKTLLSAVE